MARDRLAAMRAQQGGNADQNSYSYPTQASGPQYQNQGRRPNPYAQHDDRAYEMSDVGNSQTRFAPSTPASAAPGGDMSSFFTEVSALQEAIKTFNESVRQIGDLHSRSLNNTDDAAAQRIASQLDELVEETSAMSATLKRRIKALEAQGGPGRDGQIRRQQAAVTKSKFVEAIQNYQNVEQQYRTKYKQRLERQFKIVKPDASPEEVRAVVNDEHNGAIFSQALMSARYTDSRAAYREVQERHEDIKRIERTIAELAQLFQDMSILVEQQDDTINVIEAQADGVQKDTEAGLGFTSKAVDSARAARKKRWICFGILVVILIIVAIVIAVVVTNNNKTVQVVSGAN